MSGWLNLLQYKVLHLFLEQQRPVRHAIDVENNLSNMQLALAVRTLAGGIANLPNLCFRKLHCQNTWSEEQLGKVFL